MCMHVKPRYDLYIAWLRLFPINREFLGSILQARGLFSLTPDDLKFSSCSLNYLLLVKKPTNVIELNGKAN